MNQRTHLLKHITELPLQDRRAMLGKGATLKSASPNQSVKLGQAVAAPSPFICAQITQAAQILVIDPDHLQAWLNSYQEVPDIVKTTLLRTIIRCALDPFLEELVFAQYEPNRWESAITIHGWSTLMNRSSQFHGMTFTQSAQCTQGVPDWMECTIYRRDRMLPIIVREYFSEVQGESEAWKKMPKRMLRHRVFSQCAKIAIGL